MNRPDPAVVVGVRRPAALEVLRHPTVDGVAHVRRRRDEEREAEQERGGPAVTEAVVQVVVVALEQRRNFREAEQQLVTHRRSLTSQAIDRFQNPTKSSEDKWNMSLKQISN